MNWQTEGVNSNHRSPKFEEISPMKTGDISCESFAFFPSHKIRHKIGICRSEASFFARSLWLDTATRPYYINYSSYTVSGAVVAQLASARLSEREVPGSILSDLNVCFDFPLIRVAIALNTRKTEHWQREGGKGRTVGFHWYQPLSWRNYRR